MAVNQSRSADRVVRVTFGWLLVGGLCVVALGWLGGALAAQWWASPAPLPDATGDRLVSTVQEVTISPNTAAIARLQNAQRSVVLLAREQAGRIVPAATGAVVTNDGLVVTVADSAKALLAYDWEGKELPVRFVGEDAQFGVAYYRLSENILLPLDVRTTAVPVAYQLMGVSRSGSTFWPRTFFYPVLETALPPELFPRGVQRVLRGPGANDEALAGSPLLDDEGKLAGLLLMPAAGLALPVDHLAASIERVISGQREVDPFSEVGLNIRYEFTGPTADGSGRSFVVVVTSVAANAPAAAARVAAGDMITSVNEKQVHWEEMVLKQFSTARPLTLGVRRGEAELTLTIPP